MRGDKTLFHVRRDRGEGKAIFASWRFAAVLLMLFDVVVIPAAYFFALWLRFDCRVTQIPRVCVAAWLAFAPAFSLFCVAVLFWFRMYRSVWRFVSFTELNRITWLSLFLSALHSLFIARLAPMPIAYHTVGALLQYAALLGVRFSYRVFALERERIAKRQQRPTASRVMLIGAGAAGRMILRDLQSSGEINEHVCCIIDDDRNTWGRFLDGVPVIGGRDKILSGVEKYRIEKIFVAIPGAAAASRREILDICKESGCVIKKLPGVAELVSGSVGVGAMQDVAPEDLLGREPVRVDTAQISDFVAGKVILVTGGGGSIGSELCRQIAAHAPKRLILFDVYENNAHAIALELSDRYPALALSVLIGSVRDAQRLEQIFREFRPEVVFHAAAHKHVPLMEGSPCEAIKNNVIGTYQTAYVAMHSGCKRFVLISTDKAVNPTNIMGASKRLCEMVVQCFDRYVREGRAERIPAVGELSRDVPTQVGSPPPTIELVAVRFGNVLGSNGSVVPRFKEQIAAGGPVTVTHPDIIRYFMT
ncbi:MAG: polysaccharide biosynthesis protein, partial [Clostridia bacterium]|nr:polysaccharide biosynthesis protein [Clostridia bacterium]